MSKNERRQQKAIQRKKIKHRQQQSMRTAGSGRTAVAMRLAAKWPVRECLVSADWEEGGGLVQVLVAREGPSGQLGVAVFLVDLGCLGVKNAFGTTFPSWSEYDRELRRRIQETEDFVNVDIDLAARIIREGLNYARDLGFKPDRDYPAAAYILADADPNACDLEVKVGKDGKPFYVAGPNDNVPHILAQLERSVGADNFEYVTEFGPSSGMLGDVDEEEEDEKEEDEESGGQVTRFRPWKLI